MNFALFYVLFGIYILLLLSFILFYFFQFSLSDYPDVPFDLKDEPRKYTMK